MWGLLWLLFAAFTLQRCECESEPQSPNSKNITMHKKVGSPPIPERATKSVQSRTLCTSLAQKVRFCALLGVPSGVCRNLTFLRRLMFFFFYLGSVARTESHNAEA